MSSQASTIRCFNSSYQTRYIHLSKHASKVFNLFMERFTYTNITPINNKLSNISKHKPSGSSNATIIKLSIYNLSEAFFFFNFISSTKYIFRFPRLLFATSQTFIDRLHSYFKEFTNIIFPPS